jgi:hypothetical protein
MRRIALSISIRWIEQKQNIGAEASENIFAAVYRLTILVTFAYAPFARLSAARQAVELSDGRTFELRLHDRAIHPRTLSAPGEAGAAAATPLAALAG